MGVERSIAVRVKVLGADKFKKDMKGVSVSIGETKNWLDVTKGILGSQVITKAISTIISKFNEAADKSIAFESALAGVAKTTNFSDVGLENFGNQLMLLSERIPMTAAELAGLAEVGGQLGIAEGDLIEFTETVAAMGVSTNMSAEDAATAIARLANIFGTSSKDYDKLGSAVVALGNNFATTESEILNMSLRMAGMAAVVDMSEADVLALSTALSALGIEEAAGGGSAQKLIQTIEMAVASGDFGKFANIAGLTSNAFSEMWQTNPVQVIEQFIKGIGNVEKEGGSAAAVLKDLGIAEVRTTRSILSLASSGDLLARSLEMSNKAWEDNIALSEEASKRYATSASRIQIAQNQIDNKNIALGDFIAPARVGTKEFLGDWAAELSKAAKEIDLEEKVQKANNEFEEQKKIINDNAQTARNLVDSIAEMGSVENLDKKGQADYIAQMTALTALMPELSKLWNEETMSIEGGTAALYNNIEAIENMALASADYKKSLESADAYKIIEEDLQAKKAELALAEAELKAAESDYEQYWESVRNSGKTDAEIETGSQEYLTRYSAAIKNEANIRAEVEKAEAQLESFAYVIDDFETSSIAYVAAAGNMEAATTGINESQEKAINGLGYLQEELSSTITKYEETRDAILATLAETSSFEKIEPPEIEGPESQIEGLDSQIDFLTKYSEVLAKAKEMGVDESIISSLATGEEKDYATLASIVSGTEEDVATINAKYAEVSAARIELSEELAAAQTGLETTVSGIVTMADNLVAGVDVGGEMYAKGAADIQNLIDGINSKISSLKLKVDSVKSLTQQMASDSSPDGSYSQGLEFVPRDGFIAELHRGEMVLTALEAKAYRAEQYANYAMPAILERGNGGSRTYNNTYNDTTNFGTVVVREEEDIDRIVDKMARRNKRRAKGRGYI